MSTCHIPDMLQCTKKRQDVDDNGRISPFTNLQANFKKGLIAKEQDSEVK